MPPIPKLIVLFQKLPLRQNLYPHRKPHITVDCQHAAKDGKYFKIYYKDNGIGFKPEQSSRVFEVFHRLHNKDQYEGTGVGLAIVKKIVDQHHGTINASGFENHGATFEICFPVPK